MTTASGTKYVLYSWIAGQVFARHRQQRGVGQIEMAKALGVSQATWSRVETGQSPLTIEQLSHACELIGLSAGDIVSEVDKEARRYRRQGAYVVYRRGRDPVNVPGLVAAGLGLFGLVKVLSRFGDDG